MKTLNASPNHVNFLAADDVRLAGRIGLEAQGLQDLAYCGGGVHGLPEYAGYAMTLE